VLEADYGGYGSTFSPRTDLAAITRGLGEGWQIDEVGFKPYSTNGSCHPSIDMLLALADEHDLRIEMVDRVDLEVSSATKDHVGWPYRPETATTAQMNLPYIVAVTLRDRDAFVQQFTGERMRDPKLVEFASRVTV